MRSRAATAILSALALTLLLAATALAGGWASVVLDPPDDPSGPNQPITIGFTLLQHGVTPVDWGPTQIVMTNDATGESVSFDARPQGPAGHWVAEISVATEGTWRYEIRHDLEIAMTGFDPITVGGVAATTTGGVSAGLAPSPALLMVGAFLALLAMAAVAAGVVTYRHTRLDRAGA